MSLHTLLTEIHPYTESMGGIQNSAENMKNVHSSPVELQFRKINAQVYNFQMLKMPISLVLKDVILTWNFYAFEIVIPAYLVIGKYLMLRYSTYVYRMC